MFDFLTLSPEAWLPQTRWMSDSAAICAVVRGAGVAMFVPVAQWGEVKL
jgi:hypothetical protein